MDLVTHLPRISQEHDPVWVIVDQFTKSAHLPVVQITFALEEFCWLYIYIYIYARDCPDTWRVSLCRIGSGF